MPTREHSEHRDRYGPMRYSLDLGLGHWLRWMVWAPDLRINPHYAHLALLLRTQPVVGAIVLHECAGSETGLHEGAIHFRTELTDAWAEASRRNTYFWEVQSWQPLTLHPSLLSHCQCGDHGFIREGRWTKA